MSGRPHVGGGYVGACPRPGCLGQVSGHTDWYGKWVHQQCTMCGQPASGMRLTYVAPLTPRCTKA